MPKFVFKMPKLAFKFYEKDPWIIQNLMTPEKSPAAFRPIILSRKYLVGLELGVVQLFDGVLHVFVSKKLANAGPVFVNVGVANLASVPHVIFLLKQIFQ